MALTIEEQHETNDLDHDILATREVTFICGHKRVYEDISACQKSWMERCQRCPNCQYEGSEEIADEELYVNDRNDEHCGLSLSGSASERL